jgi:hypothetical protein
VKAYENKFEIFTVSISIASKYSDDNVKLFIVSDAEKTRFTIIISMIKHQPFREAYESFSCVSLVYH